MRLIARRRFTPLNAGGLALFSFVSFKYIDTIPLRIRETIRVWRGKRLADKYMALVHGDMKPFAEILSPFTSYKNLEHWHWPKSS